MTAHSAEASFLGYEYQALHALLLVAPSGGDTEVHIESFDDVEFKEGDYQELLQYKFSLKNKRNVTSKDESFWKTLGNWAELIESEIISTDDYHFRLVTTRETTDSLILKLTENPETRDNQKLLTEILEVKDTMNNKTLENSIQKFVTLDPGKQFELITKFRISVGSKDIASVQEEIEKHLITYTKQRFKESFFDSIYGWWYRQVLNRLSGEITKPLTNKDLVEAMERHRDLQTADALPTHFDGKEIEDKLRDTYLQNKFVEQLEYINVSKPSVFKAILNFYKATQQRIKWYEELNNIEDRLDKYDAELYEKWESEFNAIQRKITKSSSDDDLVNYGYDLYEWMERSNYYPDLKLENSLSKIWLWKGSFHILSDDCVVGWHPKFKDLLKCEANVPESL